LAQLLALISNSKTNLQTKKDLIAQLVWIDTTSSRRALNKSISKHETRRRI
jgi:hypothetical protein